jgi:hypothetical protein
MFADDPRILEAGNEAAGVLARCASWSARHLTDGRITAAAAKLIATPQTFDRLIGVGLLDRDGDGYRIVDDADDVLLHVRTKADVLKERKKWADKKRHSSPGDSPRDSKGASPGDSAGPIPIPIPIPGSQSQKTQIAPSALGVSTSSKSKKPVPAPGFDAFWSAYPKKDAKPEAVKAWNALSPQDRDHATAGAIAYARQCKRLQTERGKTKNPSGWLNGRRWEDESIASLLPRHPANTTDTTSADPLVREIVERDARNAAEYEKDPDGYQRRKFIEVFGVPPVEAVYISDAMAGAVDAATMRKETGLGHEVDIGDVAEAYLKQNRSNGKAVGS